MINRKFGNCFIQCTNFFRRKDAHKKDSLDVAICKLFVNERLELQGIHRHEQSHITVELYVVHATGNSVVMIQKMNVDGGLMVCEDFF